MTGRPAVERMPLDISHLSAESIEDAAAWWLFSEDQTWERWRLVPGSVAVSPSGTVLRLSFELEGDSFELAVIQRGPRVLVKYDDHEDPEQQIAARLFLADDDAILSFVHKDQTVFVHLELADAHG